MQEFLYRLENLADSRPDNCEFGHEIRSCVEGIYAMLPDMDRHIREMSAIVSKEKDRVSEWRDRLPKDSDFPERSAAQFMPVLQTAKKPLWKRVARVISI